MSNHQGSNSADHTNKGTLRPTIPCRFLFPRQAEDWTILFFHQIPTAPGRADVSDTHIAGLQQYLGKVREHKHQQQKGRGFKLPLHLEVQSIDVVGLAFTDTSFPDMSANINPSTCTCVRLGMKKWCLANSRVLWLYPHRGSQALDTLFIHTRLSRS